MAPDVASAAPAAPTHAPRIAEVFTTDGTFSTKGTRVLSMDRSSLPSSYRGNSRKEELCLEYVDNFVRQFVQLFPHRKLLYTHPENECGVPKFVCTTVRPTQLPFKELYDAESCAEFIAHYIRYEPLKDPSQPPGCLPAPASVLEWQRGDSFDMSVLLCSYLLGSGYDAYCVNGYAPKWVTLMDQSRLDHPELPEDRVVAEEALRGETSRTEVKNEEVNSYSIKARGVPDSKFLSDMAERERVARESKDSELEDVIEEDRKGGATEHDALEGERVHCWVLVRAGKRGVMENFFIEPSTGRRYSVRESPYLGVESVWNASNMWVNMQESTEEAMQLSFNLSVVEHWEFVFIDTRATPEGADGDDEDSDLDDEEREAKRKAESEAAARDGERILDLPSSWGERTELFLRAKLEQYAVRAHPQGMTKRLTLFSDTLRTIPREVREHFLNRRDKLKLRVRRPLEGSVTEHFEEGRVSALRKHHEISGKLCVLHFYETARLDGLVRRSEEIGVKVTEHFEGRDDGLTYRSVSFTTDVTTIPGALTSSSGSSKNRLTIPGGQLGQLTITKMTEKFRQDDSGKGDAMGISKRTYYKPPSGSIRVLYNYAAGKITRDSRIFNRDGTMEVTSVDQFAPEPRRSQLEQERRDAEQAEKACYQAVRDSERERADVLALRKREELHVQLEKSVFDTAREKSKEDSTKRDTANEESKVEKSVNQVDYLTPFLSAVNDINAITRDEAVHARDLCLKALKERLLERANIIQRRLDEENSQLAKKQAAFQRSRDHVEGADEEFEKFCSDAMFRIQILEQRLARHEETALHKYAEMDHQLRSDPRLQILSL